MPPRYINILDHEIDLERVSYVGPVVEITNMPAMAYFNVIIDGACPVINPEEGLAQAREALLTAWREYRSQPVEKPASVPASAKPAFKAMSKKEKP